MDRRTELANKEAECKALRDEIARQERECQHSWGDPVYDPEPTSQWVFERYEPHGSDPEPIGHCEPGPSKPRWKRTCQKCGKEELTLATKTVKTAPDFGSR